MMTALAMNLPLVILKKQSSRILDDDVWQATVQSFTKGTLYELTLRRAYMPAGTRALLIDDFMASGEAALGVHALLTRAGATLVGAGIVIEKAFQPGRGRLAGMGCEIFALARIAAMSAEGIAFADDQQPILPG